MAHNNLNSNFMAEEDLMNKEFKDKNLNNIEKDSALNAKEDSDNNKQTLIDPMACEDSVEDLEAKKQKWMDIFQRCPDFSNWILEIYEGTGSAGLENIQKHFEE